jgi:hypothetical protein
LNYYQVTRYPKNGGTACPNAYTTSCTVRACNPVDCEGEWIEGDCNKECGDDGEKYRYYQINKEAQDGGKCDNAGAGYSIPCNRKPCPCTPVNCEFAIEYENCTDKRGCENYMGKQKSLSITKTKDASCGGTCDYPKEVERLCVTSGCSRPPPRTFADPNARDCNAHIGGRGADGRYYGAGDINYFNVNGANHCAGYSDNESDCGFAPCNNKCYCG